MEPRQLLAADFSAAAVKLGAVTAPEGNVQVSPSVESISQAFGSIAGQVYLTSSPRCLNLSSETGIEGASLRLLNETGVVLQERQTDVNGSYRFDNLSTGVYAVFEVQSAVVREGVAHLGTGGGIAFDQNLLGEIFVQAGSDYVGYNFCNYSSDSPIETGAGGAPPVVPHSGGGASEVPSGVVLQLLYGTAVTPSESQVPQFESSPALFDSNVLVPLPTATFVPRSLIGGSDLVATFTWQLSVFDVGASMALRPRSNPFQLASTSFDVSRWQQMPLDQGSWLIAESASRQNVAHHDAVFGHPDATPIAGDWDGDGRTEIGIFLEGDWYLDLNGNGSWDETDLWAHLGKAGDLPVVGDWDADGRTDIGVVSVSQRAQVRREIEALAPTSTEAQSKRSGERKMCCTVHGKVHADAVDHVFHYGSTGDFPITGDWNGNGYETIAVFRDGLWHLDVDGDGCFTSADQCVRFGQAGDLPVVGDWDANGTDDLGVFRQGLWIVDHQGNRRLDAEDYDRAFELGGKGDQPVVGDWDGDGADEPAVYCKEALGVRL